LLLNHLSASKINLNLHRLKDAFAGLLYLSESEYPFEVISFNASTGLEERLQAESSRGKTIAVRVVTLEQFFRNMTKVPSGSTPELQHTAQQFQQLQQVLKEEL
jgi:hypothetical protein